MTPRVYTIEVCGVCGGPLSNRFMSAGFGSDPGTGRCATSRDHWSTGGVLLDVVALPASEQGTGWPERRNWYPKRLPVGVLP